MESSQAITCLLSRLWHHIDLRRRRQIGLLLILMIFASFAEILSIGAVFPFLAALTAPERVFAHPASQPFIHFLGLSEPSHLLFPLTVAFGLAAILAGGMRMFLLWTSTRLSYAIGADLSIGIYRRTLYQPYAVHVARNSSVIINGISNKTNIVIQTILHFLTLIGSCVMLAAILIALLFVDPFMALSVLVGFGSIYGSITWWARSRILTNSERIATESTRVIKSLQEGLGGIRDVLIDGSQSAYCQIYRNADIPLRRAQGSSIFISGSPRYAMEALGMLLIASLAYMLIQQPDGIAKVVPVLGIFAVGAQRLLPVLQQMYGAGSTIQAAQHSMLDAVELLDQPLPDCADQPPPKPLPFRQSISLNQVSFRYSSQTAWVLKKINLKIERGDRIGFVGTTGSGKSTLLDIIMGLLQPSEGVIEIDSQPITLGNQRSWQAHIAHVPQFIFLADSSIEENIAFGVPEEEIDHERVRQAACQAQIDGIIETWPEKYKTFVGERGVRLSGGQRQRIGIARALYKQADIIIFDEATSSLDNETEGAVMQAIESLGEGLTILIIAHRLTTLKNCTQIVELGDGGIKRTGTYQEIITKAV